MALAAIGEAGLAAPAALKVLEDAWSLQQDLSQLLKAALEDDADPAQEPAAFRRMLARAGGARDFRALHARLAARRAAARKAFVSILTF